MPTINIDCLKRREDVDDSADMSSCIQETETEIKNENENKNEEEIKNENEEEEENDEDLIGHDHRMKVFYCQLYVGHFGHLPKMKPYMKMDFDKMTSKQLVLIREEINTMLNVDTSITGALDFVRMAILYLESILVKHTPLKVTGTANILLSSPIFVDDVKHMLIENMIFTCASPEWRVGSQIIKALILTHGINSENEKGTKENIKKEDVINNISLKKQSKLEELSNKFGDL